MTAEHIRHNLTTVPDALDAAHAEAGNHLAAAPERPGYDLAQCDDDPQSFILRTHWISGDVQMAGFRRV